MQNPKLSTYSVEELFTLKPVSTQLDAAPMKPEYTSRPDINLTTTEAAADHLSAWSKYKWLIIGGTIVVGCICWYAYKKNKKDNSKQTN